MRTLIGLLQILMVLPEIASPVSADDWPNWMGPRLDGVSIESGWTTNWAKEGLPIEWTAELGIGFSSLSVAGNRVLSMGHSEGEESVWCLNAATGKEIWRHSYDAPLNNNLYEGGPGATPTVLGGRVYSLGIAGRLTCLSLKDGSLVWERDLKQVFQIGLHEWGFNSSPYLLDGRLYVQGGRLGCFDAVTGDLVWKSEPHAAGYGSVRLLEVGGDRHLVSLDCEGLRVSEIENGAEVDLFKWKSPFATNSTTPIVVGHRIYISTGYNVGCGFFEFVGGKLNLVYRNKRMRNHFNNSILYQGHVYGFDGNSNLGRVVTLTCMELETGDVKWKQRGLGCGSLMIANGWLVVLGEEGTLELAAADSERYEPVASSKLLTGRCWTVPVLANGRIFARNASGKLVCSILPKVD